MIPEIALQKRIDKYFQRAGKGVKVNKKIIASKLPKHIAFIMDGNGRWAVKRGWVRWIGHRFGYERMLMAVRRCADYKIPVCSLFAFSTENWNRSKVEVDEIFRLIRENMERDVPEFMKGNIKVTAMGDISKFPKDLRDKLYEVVEQTKNNTGTILNICANYGGRADIVRAVNTIIAERTAKGFANAEKKNAKTKAEKGKSAAAAHTTELTENDFAQYLYHPELPPPDMIIRTSGEQRISNFMLWQMAYSEFLFIKAYWPDVTPRTIDKCLLDFQKRKRRYGRIPK